MMYSRGARDMPQSAEHDLGRRALFASVGGGIFVFLATVGFQGRIGMLPSIAAVVVAVLLIVGSMVALTNADRALAANPALASDSPRSAKIRRSYIMTTQLEYVGFIVVLIICNLFNQMVWLLPLVAIIAGIHYLVLGRILRSVSAWAKGAILCVATVAVVAFLPAVYPPHAAATSQVYLWWIVVGFIAGAVLWSDAIVCLAQAFRSRKAAVAG